MNVAPRPKNGLSLCSGGAGLDMGLMLAEPGFHTGCFVEWEEHPRSVLINAQKAGHLTPAPIWDDLTTFDAKPFRGAFDTLLAGYPCFVAGTIITTKRGYIPIEQVAVGDKVLTHKGRWRRVTARMGKACAPVRRIKAQGVPEVVCTDGHPFYGEGGTWTRADHLERGHRVGQVLPKIINDDRSAEFWWVIGRYLADGWRQWSPSQQNRKRGRISICCARHEADELERRIINAGFKPYRSEERTTTRFAITRHSLYEFCGQFGEGASGKHLPGWVLGLDQEKSRALCEGYFSGDGYRYKNPRGSGGGWRVTTVSRGLALSFAALSQRAFGVVASVRRYQTNPKTSIEGRIVSQRDQYFLTVPDRNRSGRVDGRYAWKMVRSNEPCGTADVFNIAIEDDESYIADGAIVHNCQPFSHAGQRKGEDDERHLWPDIERIIDELTPDDRSDPSGLRWIFLENVSGHVTLGAETVLRALRRLGFTPAVGLFTASEVGAPHKRERWFCVAYRPCERAGEQNNEIGSQSRENARRGIGGGFREELADSAGRGCGKRGDAPQPRRCGHPNSRDKFMENTGRSERRSIDAEGNKLDGPQAGWVKGSGGIAEPSADVDHAEPLGRTKGGHDNGSDVGNVFDPTNKFADMADAKRSAGHKGGASLSRSGNGARGKAPTGLSGSRPDIFPPGPSDHDAWARVLGSTNSDLAPALGVDDILARAISSETIVQEPSNETLEPFVRRVADGLAARSRALKLLGNGVVPLVAAYAWRTLSTAHGLGPVDLGTADGTERE